MKPKHLWLLFHGLWSIALVVSCKSSEVNPIDNLVGLYQGDTYPKGYIPNNFSDTRVTLSKVYDDVISVTIYNSKSIAFAFPKCKIVMIDTVGNTNPPFAKIMNIENNREVGKMRHWVDYPNWVKTKYIQLRLEFSLDDSTHFLYYPVYKWADD